MYSHTANNKVLVADDDIITRQLVEITLTKSGFEPVTAVDGVEALTILRSSDAPRLAVIDWLMPSMDGLELSRKIRESEAAYYTYVVLLTSRNCKVDQFAAMHAGIDYFLSKPWKPEELIGALRIGQRLLAREERFTKIIGAWRTMIDNAPFGMACLAEDGAIVRANAMFLNLLGGKPQDIVGENISRTLLRKVSDSKGLLDCIRFREPFNDVPLEVSRLDCSTRQAKLWGRPIDNMPGVAYGIVTSIVE